MNFQNNVSENSEFAEKVPKSRKAAKMASLSLYNIILEMHNYHRMLPWGDTLNQVC